MGAWSAGLRRHAGRAAGRGTGIVRARAAGGGRLAGRWLGAACLATLLVLFSPCVARAGFSVCNQTLDVVNLAVGAETDHVFQTEGWWTIGANQCVNVIRKELTDRYIYIYAADVFGHAILAGSTEMCVDSRRFAIRGIEDCWQRGHVAARFYEVDTRDQARWTFFLTDRGP